MTGASMCCQWPHILSATGTYCAQWVDPFATDIIRATAATMAAVDEQGVSIELAAAALRTCAGFRGYWVGLYTLSSVVQLCKLSSAEQVEFSGTS